MSDGCINVRGDSGNAEFLAAAESALGQSLPLEPNTTTHDGHCIYWLGPDEWLVQTSAERRGDVLGSLEAELASTHTAVNDLSGGNVVLRLRGDEVIEVLAKGCTLDLRAMADGNCAQTGLGKAGVLLRRDAENDFTIIVRRSFADYLVQWLEHAGGSHGIEFG